MFESMGARVTMLPTIAIEPVSDWTAVDNCTDRLATFDWIVFTSANGVRAFAQRLSARGLGWNIRGRARVAAIGPATAAALNEQDISIDFIPPEYVAESIAAGLGNVAGQHVLLLRADIARQALADELRIRGADVEEVPVYRTAELPVSNEVLTQILRTQRADVITFTSSSTARSLISALRRAGHAPEKTLDSIVLAAIGPITAATLHEYHLEPAIVAGEFTTEGLLRAVVDYFSTANNH
jgi:uroporphyrinogen-III synthase